VNRIVVALNPMRLLTALVLLLSQPQVHAAATYRVASVTIREPTAPEWRVQDKSEHRVVFFHRDEETDSDFIAIGSHFEPQWPSSDANFLQEFKKHVEVSNAIFQRVLSSRYEVTRERGYLCARAFVVGEQPSNTPDSASRLPVRVHARTLACRKGAPSREGLFAFFQYVRQEPSEVLDSQAESFLQGVQFYERK
jgi:hypothetical protein